MGQGGKGGDWNPLTKYVFFFASIKIFDVAEILKALETNLTAFTYCILNPLEYNSTK